MAADKDARIARGTVIKYAIGSIGTGGFGTLPGLVLVYYLTDSLGVTALLAGILVTAAKVWDVIIDPVIGARSDDSLVATGSRRRFMLLGAITLPLFFLLTFAVPHGTEPVVAGFWVLIFFVLAATSFSVFQVPYIALPAELTPDYDERTRLLTWRVVVLTFAILLFGAGGPALRSLGGGGASGYLLMALIAGLVMGLGLAVAAFSAPRKQYAPPRPRTPIRELYAVSIRTLKRSQSFRVLLLTFLLQGLATGMMLAGAQYVATWVLVNEDAVTLLFLALIAPAILAAPVWRAIADRVGKERSLVVASILFALAALSLTALLFAPGAWVYAPVALAGIAYAGMQSLPMAMLPDVIAHDAARHGAGKAGSFGGMWTAGETLGMALGATGLSIVLAVTGYVERIAGDDRIRQSQTAIDGIVVSFSIVPAVIILLSLIPLSRYRLRKADVPASPAPGEATTA